MKKHFLPMLGGAILIYIVAFYSRPTTAYPGATQVVPRNAHDTTTSHNGTIISRNGKCEYWLTPQQVQKFATKSNAPNGLEWLRDTSDSNGNTLGAFVLLPCQ
jgi:hypothetical protein